MTPEQWYGFFWWRWIMAVGGFVLVWTALVLWLVRVFWINPLVDAFRYR